MPRLNDRVRDTTTTTGTGAVTLSGTAPSGGFQTFAAALAVGDQTEYMIVNTTTGEWETGLGQLTASTTLARNQAYSGSSGVNTFVNFGAGTKDVVVANPAAAAKRGGRGSVTHLASGMALP